MAVSWDVESFLIQPGLLAPPPVCASFAHDGVTTLVLPDRALQYLRRCFTDGIVLVGANVSFDFAVMCAYDETLIPAVFKHYERGLVRDVRIRQQLLDIAAGCLNLPRADGTKGYSLADLEKHYLGRDRSAEKHDPLGWRMRYGELDGVPIEEWPDDAVRYAKEDAAGTLEVFRAQGPERLTNEVEQVQAAWALHLMNAWGIRTDGEAVTTLEAKLLEAQAKNRKWLHRAGFFKTRRATRQEVEANEVDEWEAGKCKDPGPFLEAPLRLLEPEFRARAIKAGLRPLKFAKDMARVQATVEKHYKRRHKPVPQTDSGRVATDKDTLTRSGSRILGVLADGGGVDKILQTYVPALKHGTQYPITSRANVLVNSGRTSWANPNLQNLPTGRRVGGVRECFVPRPGYWFVSCDYDTLELRALAQVNLWLFGYSRMAEVIRQGRDLHSHQASEITGIPYEQIEARKKIKGSPEKAARDCAKVALFGYGGGLGAATMVDYARIGYGITLTFEQSARLKAEYLAAWPEMVEYFRYVSSMTAGGETQIKQFVSNRLRGGVGYTDACNGMFQSLAADGAKSACFAASHECYVDKGTALFGSRPVAFIHDELLVEVPEDTAHEASQRLAQVMCEQMSRYIPDVPITASPALMRRWYKDADKVEVEGRLVPWEPKAA